MKRILLFCSVLISSSSFSGIDPNIPMMSKGVDILGSIREGNDLGQKLKKIRVDREISRIYKESNGDSNKMLRMASESNLSRWVVPYFQDQISTQKILELNQLKVQSEIAKSNAETQLNITQRSAPPMTRNTSNTQSRVSVDYIDTDLYKTDDDRLIKTNSCSESVSSERAIIANDKLVFRSGRSCQIDSITDF